jgi:hypothetical protein
MIHWFHGLTQLTQKISLPPPFESLFTLLFSFSLFLVANGLLLSLYPAAFLHVLYIALFVRRMLHLPVFPPCCVLCSAPSCSYYDYWLLDMLLRALDLGYGRVTGHSL